MSAARRWPTRTHFHSDCYTFSGSETTLLLLVAAAAADRAAARFTYRRWPAYERGLRRRLPVGVDADGIRLPDPVDVKHAVTRDRRTPGARLVRAAISLAPLRQFCLLYDVVRLFVLLRRERPDVLHVNNGGLPGAISCNAAAIAGRLAGVPSVVLVVNNLAVPYRRPSRWFDLPVDRLVVRSVSRFVTGSAAAGAALREVLHLPADRHVVIPNGVERRAPSSTPAQVRDQVGIPVGSTVVAVVARLEVRKGHRDLFTALSSIPAAELAEVVVLVAGDGPERDGLERLVGDLGLDAHVRFLGEHPDPWSLYEASDLVVLPSIDQEDLPIVLIEAMAAGRPVVATAVAGAVELVDDGITGLLVAPARPERLAAALRALLRDPDRRAAMGDAGRRRYAERYTPDRAVAGYQDLYERLAAEAAS